MSAPLPVDLAPMRLAAVVAVPTPQLITPAEAVSLLPVSLQLLWVEHLTLGGTLDLDAFRTHLLAPDPAHPEHEVVLETLEAALADEGVPARVR
ncbi:hypothetical protein TEK04_19930 [Klenkia sp. LSe6-5]|uniref:Uncharacterized protein n=1 Tax=Klenkia sesuvii TaxID=3103137 RepID=A0ABU8DZ90_9ACTN